MKKTDLRDFLDGSTVRAQSWGSVVERYRDIPAAAPLVRLAVAIRDCRYASLLFPVTSMFDIRIYQVPDTRFSRECLIVRFDFEKKEFEMEYLEHHEITPHWKKRCSIEESFSAFIHFLALKNWFPVHEIPRGVWTCE
ncbi:MAG TPA: hypothetical protein VK717_13240 [Opitutaceae bacterium]|jgi:hypothetical protein|nr:hypothetical protein [Opitutaceae bacterium]